MSAPEEKWRAHRPWVGDAVTYRPHTNEAPRTGRVTRVEGNLCWVLYPGAEDPDLFIWCFRDTLNTHHDWKRKP